MNRVSELEKALRDHQIINIEVQLEYFMDEKSNDSNYIKLKFLRNEGSTFSLVLLQPMKLDLFDDELTSHYITHVKCLFDGNSYSFSFDPKDERSDIIEDSDNYVFICREYKIIEE